MRQWAIGMLIGVALVAGAARAEDEKIGAAQEKLRAARDDLKTASGAFDGHRARAVNHIERALDELRGPQHVGDRRDGLSGRRVDRLDGGPK